MVEGFHGSEEHAEFRVLLLGLALLVVLGASGCLHMDTGPADSSNLSDGDPDIDPSSNASDDGSGDDARGVTVINPHPDVERELKKRKEMYSEQLEGSDVKVDFGFTYVEDTGIGFEHTSTPDSGREYKPNHYDHGNSVSVADVNGDGHLDVYFTNQLGPNELWINEGDGNFVDGTTEDLAMADRVSTGASFGDVNNDGRPDLFVTSIREGNELFINSEDGFEVATDEAGVDYEGHSSSSVLFDYNNDGYLDILMLNIGEFTTEELHERGYYVGEGEDDRFGSFNNHLDPGKSEPSLLYENQGDGTFEEVGSEVGLEELGWTGDAVPVYFQGNDYPGLYVFNMQGDDSYFENSKGEFTERTDTVFGETPWGTMGGHLLDYELDGDMDLYLTDMHSDMHGKLGSDLPVDREDQKLPERFQDFYSDPSDNIFGNAFYVNGADGFKEKSIELGLENYWPWGVSVADVNADGYEDVFVAASMNYQFKYVPSYLMLNDHGEGFVHAEFATGVEPRPDGRTSVPWFELECSGVDSEHRHCHHRQGEVVVEAPLGSRSSVFFDADGDGDLDLMTNEFNSAPRYLLNNLSKSPITYLKVELVGRESNRDGLGARVTLNSRERSYVHYNDGQSGYLAQSSKPMYFGLSDADPPVEIVVDWPSGQTSRIQVEELDRTVTVIEGSS